MTVITRCLPPLPVDTPMGPGLAHWRIEHGLEMPTTYEVWLLEGEHAREIREFRQTEIRAQSNMTAGRE